MKKIIRLTIRLPFVICYLLFVILLTACGNPGGDSDDDQKEKQITITFETDGGSAVSAVGPITIASGSTYSLSRDYFGTGSKVPTKADNRFTGWLIKGTTTVITANTNSANKFDKNTTLIAQWVQLKNITITFNMDGGSPALAPLPLKEGSTLTSDYFGTGSKVPAKTGYRFNGWKDNAGPINNATKFSDDTTLTAQWVLRVNVSFNLGKDDEDNEAPGTPPKTVVIDAGLPLGDNYPKEDPWWPSDDPSFDHYKFTGWYNGTTKYEEGTIISTTVAAFILTAQWEKVPLLQNAQTPAIHPGNHFQETGGTTRTVKVNEDIIVNGLFTNIEKGAGVLSVKWYRTTIEADANASPRVGDVITVEQDPPEFPYTMSLPFKWKESTPGTYWYWVVVTNTNNKAEINKTATETTQTPLKVTVTE